MSDLVARVTERLDELERVAEAAANGPWVWDGWSNGTACVSVDAWDVATLGGAYVEPPSADTDGLLIEGDLSDEDEARWKAERYEAAKADATHIALNDPDQTKRLVAGLRAVVGLHGSDDGTFCNACTTAWPCPTLTALASIWEVGS